MIAVATNDLFFRVKIDETAKQGKIHVDFVENLDEISKDMKLLIIDLNFSEFDPVKSIEKLKLQYPEMKIIGYLSHVQTELKEAALRAGCDEVLPRSQFSKNLAEIQALYR